MGHTNPWATLPRPLLTCLNQKVFLKSALVLKRATFNLIVFMSSHDTGKGQGDPRPGLRSKSSPWKLPSLTSSLTDGVTDSERAKQLSAITQQTTDGAKDYNQVTGPPIQGSWKHLTHPYPSPPRPWPQGREAEVGGGVNGGQHSKGNCSFPHPHVLSAGVPPWCPGLAMCRGRGV